MYRAREEAQLQALLALPENQQAGREQVHRKQIAFWSTHLADHAALLAECSAVIDLAHSSTEGAASVEAIIQLGELGAQRCCCCCVAVCLTSVLAVPAVLSLLTPFRPAPAVRCVLCCALPALLSEQGGGASSGGDDERACAVEAEQQALESA